jgi:hypothetical protein
MDQCGIRKTCRRAQPMKKARPEPPMRMHFSANHPERLEPKLGRSESFIPGCLWRPHSAWEGVAFSAYDIVGQVVTCPLLLGRRERDILEFATLLAEVLTSRRLPLN